MVIRMPAGGGHCGLEGHSETPEAYFTLAGNYQREGRLAEAIEIYKQAKLAKHLPMEAKRYAAQMEKQLRSGI